MYRGQGACGGLTSSRPWVVVVPGNLERRSSVKSCSSLETTGAAVKGFPHVPDVGFGFPLIGCLVWVPLLPGNVLHTAQVQVPVIFSVNCQRKST